MPSRISPHATRLCVADPYIRDFHGHYTNYASSVAEGARALGIDCTTLCAADARPEILAVVNGRPTFETWWRPRRADQRWFGGPAGVVLDAMLGARSFYRGLRRDADLIDERTLLFVPNADRTNLPALPFWLSQRDPRRAPELVVMLRETFFPPHRPYRSTAINKWAIRRLESLSPTRRIRYVTDSARLAVEYRAHMGLSIDVVPIPHTAAATRVASRVQPRSPGRIRFVSLGGARRTKGFLLIAQAINLLSSRGELDDLAFDLHCYSGTGDAGVDDAIRSLRSNSAVSIIDQTLPESAYYKLLENADAVLLPYPWEIYRSPTSGPFVEALAAAKPVVVTDDTWMSDELARNGAGIRFRNGDPVDFARAIRELADNRSAFESRAREAQPCWAAFHNPTNFVRMLMNGASQDQPRSEG